MDRKSSFVCMVCESFSSTEVLFDETLHYSCTVSVFFIVKIDLSYLKILFCFAVSDMCSAVNMHY